MIHKQKIVATFLILAGLIISLGISFYLYNRKVIPPIEEESVKTVTTTSTTLTGFYNPKNLIGKTKKVVLSDNRLVNYTVVRNGFVKNDATSIDLYDIEIKTDNPQLLVEEDLIVISKEIISIVGISSSDVKELDLFFFSDRALIENHPFDIAQATWILPATLSADASSINSQEGEIIILFPLSR